jgi:pimeloyl-ACP methyl ester carboxylesterase
MANFLCLRGLVRARGHWGPFPKIFRERLNLTKGAPHDLYFIDGPGNGEFVNLQSPRNIEAHTKFIRSKWQELLTRGEVAHPETPLWLVGISLGGMISLDWLKQFPTEVRGAVVINSSLADLSGPFRRFQLKNIPKVLNLLAFPGSAEATERKILDLTTALLSPSEKDAWAKENAKVPLASKANFFRQLIAAKNYRLKDFDRIKALNKPILVVVGEKDGLVSPKCGEKIAAHLNASLVGHALAGHDLPLEAPQWLADQICNFVSYS